MLSKVIIPFANGYGAGKTTLAKHIRSFYIKNKKNAGIFSFASPLKRSVCSFLNSIDFNPNDKQAVIPDLGINLRTIYQQYADFCKCIYGNDIFIKLLVKSIPDDLDILIIDDCRYIKELEYFKNRYDITTIHILSDRATPSKHHSEGELVNYKSNFIFVNDKDIDFNEELKKLTNYLIKTF